MVGVTIQGARGARVILFAIPALLLVPAMYWSLTTPFALIGDMNPWDSRWGLSSRILGSPTGFADWLHGWLVDPTSPERYVRFRPAWELHQAVNWKIFGATPWLHYLSGWIAHLGAVGVWSGAFLCFCRKGNGRRSTPPQSDRAAAFLFLPLAYLVHTWIFFPNAPYARLGPQETLTVFFLGLCVWGMALLVRGDGAAHSERRTSSTLFRYGLLNLGCIGLLLSKEVNIAAVLWVLVFHHVLLFKSGRGRDRRALVGSLPTVLMFVHALWTLSRIAVPDPEIPRSSYARPDISPDMLADNAVWLFNELLQTHTSPWIAVGFLCLVAVLPAVLAARLAGRRRLRREHLFILFLLGLFAAIYTILCTSWLRVLRYWYPLVPVLTMLLAFSAKFILEVAARARARILANAATAALSGFLIFFVACNYYNFLWQTFVWHSLGDTESRLISEIVSLHDRGQDVRILAEPHLEAAAGLRSYFTEYSPRHLGRSWRVHQPSPSREETSHYLVSWLGFRPTPGELDIYKIVGAGTDPAILSHASTVAAVLQGGKPRLSGDGGVRWPDNYKWHIYRSARAFSLPDYLAARAADLEEFSTPVVRSDFDVYHDDDVLVFVRDACDEADLRTRFFLQVYPTRLDDLPKARQPYGFANFQFHCTNDDGKPAAGALTGLRIRYGLIGEDNRCIVEVPLPGYAIRRIRIGQYVPGGGRIWEGEILPANTAQAAAGLY